MAEISIRDLIVKRLAVKMRINETDVDAVITHQFKGIVQALRTEDTVELAGFGKFVFSKRRATLIVEGLKRKVAQHLTTGEKLPNNKPLATIQQEIEQIEKRIYGDKTIPNTGGSNESGI